MKTTLKYSSLLLQWLSSRTHTITNVCKDKGERTGMSISITTMENSMEVPQKTKSRTAI
jgi:hypothetical protein